LSINLRDQPMVPVPLEVAPSVVITCPILRIYFPGITQHLPKPRYTISLVTLWTCGTC
jgi:hypothetical protein